MTLRCTDPTPLPAVADTAAEPTAAHRTLQTSAIPYIQQRQDNWCWAACCAMLRAWRGLPSMEQCDMATARFQLPCCADPGSDGCDRIAWPHLAYPSFGINVARSAGALKKSALAAEISAGRPVLIYFAWTAGGAHVALVTNAYSDGWFEVLDPSRARGAGRRQYNTLLTAYGEGEWAMTFTLN